MPSDNARLNTMVDTMIPATINPNGRYLTIRFGFYPNHSAFNATERPDQCVHCNDDVQLVIALAELVRKARRRQQQEQEVPLGTLPDGTRVIYHPRGSGPFAE